MDSITCGTVRAKLFLDDVSLPDEEWESCKKHVAECTACARWENSERDEQVVDQQMLAVVCSDSDTELGRDQHLRQV